VTFDLTSDQKGRENSEEPFRRATEEGPSPGWAEEKTSCDQKEHYTVTYSCEYNIRHKLEEGN